MTRAAGSALNRTCVGRFGIRRMFCYSVAYISSISLSYSSVSMTRME